MKRTAFLALTALACFFASCQKDDTEYRKEEDLKPLVFTASIDADTTKTHITIVGDKGKFAWEQGDLITVTRVYDPATAVYRADQSGPTSTFTYVSGTVFNTTATYTATYGDIDHQTWSPTGANCPLAAPATFGTAFTFTASAAMLKINVKANGITVKELHAEGKTLDCGSGVALNASTGTDFYIAVHPGTYSGLTFTLTATDNTECTKTKKTPITLEANQIQPITLGDPLTFTAPVVRVPVTTYYDPQGPLSAPPYSFTQTITSNRNEFMLAFSTANGNAINWENGDMVEAKFAWAEGNGLFSIGDGSGRLGTTINLVSSMVSGDKTTTIGIDQPLWANSQNLPVNTDPIWVRFSLNGFEYSADGVQYVPYTHGQTAVDAILAKGTDTPLDVGAYLDPITVNYEYLKVTRMVAQ